MKKLILGLIISLSSLSLCAVETDATRSLDSSGVRSLKSMVNNAPAKKKKLSLKTIEGRLKNVSQMIHSLRKQQKDTKHGGSSKPCPPKPCHPRPCPKKCH